MFRKISSSFSLAWSNIRGNFFHTFLSVLGVVIGVGAVVSNLSLIDGMEKFARDQIATTTSLNAIFIRTEGYKEVNGVRIRKDSTSFIDYTQFRSLQHALSRPVKATIVVASAGEVIIGSSHQIVGVNVMATSSMLDRVTEAGASLDEHDIAQQMNHALVNSAFLKAAKIPTSRGAMGQSIRFNNKALIITGILAEEKNKVPQVYFPVTLLSREELAKDPPSINLEALHTEDIQTLKTEINSWLKSTYPRAPEDFKIITNEFRVEQAAKGFLLFRVIMGLIVGISVVVGGIGVMNVLLISVTERTREIGIRKAVGANRGDIILLFLSESITVSAFGSILGVVFGVVSTMIIVPIIKAVTKVPFQAAYTFNTFFIISIISISIGIVFGTYPALRASRLNPVDAIRHE
jgi:putative ABC transport system permease protein